MPLARVRGWDDRVGGIDPEFGQCRRAVAFTGNRWRRWRVIEDMSVAGLSGSLTRCCMRWPGWLACCAVLAVTGCTGPGTSPARPAGSQTVPAATACAAAALRILAGREGEQGTAAGFIEFTNAGARPCMLRGMPAVSILRASGTPLPVRQVPGPTGGVTIGPATLPARGRGAAELVVSWANWCGPRPGPLLVRIAIPGVGLVTGPFDGPPDYDYVPPCLAPGQPSEISVISAYQPAPH
jgi:Protein of unknown function (DUF4232)